MRLPIKALKELANKYGYAVVVVYAFEADRKVSHVATWGRTIKLGDQAAQWGNMLKDALGWPKRLHAIPARVKKWQQRIKALEAFHPRAMKLMRKRKNFLVVAHDEPYFKQVYDLIRYSESLKGTWSEEDERQYQETFPEWRLK